MAGMGTRKGERERWGGLQLRTRKHERTKGGGGSPASARCSGVIVGSASADREIAKPRKDSETTEAPACATAPARPAALIEIVCGLHARPTDGAQGKPTKSNAPNPPWIRSLPTDGTFRGFLFLSRFRDSAKAHLALTRGRTHRKPGAHRPLSSFRVPPATRGSSARS